MQEVKKLKKARKFVVEEWMDVYRRKGVTDLDTGYKVKEYIFEYGDGKLTVANSNNKAFEVLNGEQTLRDLAKEEQICFVHIQPIDGVSFNLYNPRIRFFKKKGFIFKLYNMCVRFLKQ